MVKTRAMRYTAPTCALRPTEDVTYAVLLDLLSDVHLVVLLCILEMICSDVVTASVCISAAAATRAHTTVKVPLYIVVLRRSITFTYRHKDLVDLVQYGLLALLDRIR